MSSLIENRERASRKRERFCKRLSNAIVTSVSDTQQAEDVSCMPLRESITKLETTIAYLNSEITSCQQVLMEYDEQEESSEVLQGPDPQLIVDCVTDIDELRYLLTKLIEQTIEKVRDMLLFGDRMCHWTWFAFSRVLKRTRPTS